MNENRPLRYAVIEITNRCNLRCRHCASTSGQARANELSLDEICSLLGDIRELGGEEITIIGGEALLHEDWIQVCQTVRDLGMELILISNGLLIKGLPMLHTLRQLDPLVIGISLDGADQKRYRELRGADGFDHCMSTLRQLVADGCRQVNAITTFMQSNLDQFDDFVRLLSGTGIVWQIQLANHGGRRFSNDQFLTRQQFAWLTDRMRNVFAGQQPSLQLRHMNDFGYFPLDPALRFLHSSWNGCIAGVELIGVRSNGDVLGCLSLGDDFIEGNIRELDLPTLWKSSHIFNRFRHKERLLTGHCLDCPHALECRAGCSAIAYSATGALGCNPYCIRQLETEQILSDIPFCL